MHTMDKVWIAAAAGVAMASIALSVLIVRLVPEDPYATQERHTARVEALRTTPTQQSSVLDPRRLYEPRTKDTRVRRDDGLGINAVCAAIGVVLALSSMFAFFAWEDRRSLSPKGHQAIAGDDTWTGRQDTSTSASAAFAEERRRRARRSAQESRDVACERRQSARRIVDSITSTTN